MTLGELDDGAIPARVTHHRGRPLRERRDGDSWIVIGLHAYFEMGDQEHLVWTMIDGQRNLEAITRSVSERYGLDERVVAPEIRAFCAQLAHENLIEWKVAT